MQLMSQLQAQVPLPLRHHLPALLPPGGVAAPAIGILLVVFICQRRLESPPVQVQLDDIGGGECLLWQVGKEEFVNDTLTRDTHWTLPFASRVSCYDHAASHAFGPHWHLWTVVEAAHHLAFWALLELIWWEVQTCLNQWMIQDRVFLATGHKGEPGQINKHGSGPILAIEPQQGVCLWEVVRREIPCDGSFALTQFLPIPTVAPVTIRAEPLVAVCLADDGARDGSVVPRQHTSTGCPSFCTAEVNHARGRLSN